MANYNSANLFHSQPNYAGHAQGAGQPTVSCTGTVAASIGVHAVSVFMSSVYTGVPEDAGNANPDSDFRFDPTLGPLGGYIFNLQTKGLGGERMALRPRRNRSDDACGFSGLWREVAGLLHA